MTLQDFANIATALGFFLLAYQIYLQRRDQHNQQIAQLFDRLLEPDFRGKIQFVFTHKPENLIPTELSGPDLLIVTEVTARLEELGLKVRKGIVPNRETI